MGYPDWQENTTLASLIAGALATAGIPVLGNPLPLYNITASQGAGTPALVGATIDGAPWNPPLTPANEIATFDTYVNGNPAAKAAKTFMTEGNWPSQVPAIDQALINAGAVIYRSFKPSRTLSTAEKNNLAASLAMYQAAGANLRCVLWSECQDTFTTAQSWLQYWAYYQPVIKAAGLPAVYDCASSKGETNIAAYWPSPVPDHAIQDWYWTHYLNGTTLGTLIQLCTQNGVPVGVGEWNCDSNSQKTPTSQQWSNYINYMISSLQAVMAGGGALSAVMFFMGAQSATQPNNQLLSASDWKVPGFNQIQAALSVPASFPGQVINAGFTTTLTPLNPTPVAGYALANGQSYDLSITLTAGAGSTVPFAQVELTWLNDDIAGAPIVARQRWQLPAGVSTSAGTVINGIGPMRGRYLQVKVLNRDTVAMIVQFRLNSTSRTVARDDWRWEAPASANVPTYTLPAGASYGLMEGEAAIGPIAGGGGSQSFLFSMFAGRVYARLVINGAAANRSVHVTIGPQPPGAWGTQTIFSTYLPLSGNAGDNDQAFEIMLPRGPCQVTITNNDANAITGSINFTIDEKG